MPRVWSFLLLGITAVRALQAQPAPAPFLQFSDSRSEHVDTLVTRIMVDVTAPSTYFETQGWNAGSQGGGYCGLQDSGRKGKNYIFSLWDPISGAGKPRVIFADARASVGRFTGEGSGIHYLNYRLQWQKGRWYKLVTKVWNWNGHTLFGFWSDDEEARLWAEHAIFDFPVAGVLFSGSSGAFIEDWGGNGERLRSAEYDACRHSRESGWTAALDALFSVNTGTRNGRYRNAFNAGVREGHYYMQTGGNTAASAAPGSRLSGINRVSLTPLAAGRIVSALASYDPRGGHLTVSWRTDAARPPQFSYKVDIFENAELAGDPLLSRSDSAPNTTAVTWSGLPPGSQYYVRLVITDILGGESPPVSILSTPLKP